MGRKGEQLTEHQAGNGDDVQASHRFWEPFVIPGETAEATRPGETALPHSAPGQQDHASLGRGQLDDRQRDPAGGGITRSLRDLRDVGRDQGDVARSLAAYRECLLLIGDQGDLRVIGNAPEGAALAAVAWKQTRQAARLLGAAEAIRDQCGAAIVVPPTDRAAPEQTVDEVRAALSDEEFDMAWSAGCALPLASVTAEVHALASPGRVSRTVIRGGTSLSRRELDVPGRLVTGYPDRAIAAELFISVRTIEHHVARILAKLDVPTRTAAATAAITPASSSPPLTPPPDREAARLQRGFPITRPPGRSPGN